MIVDRARQDFSIPTVEQEVGDCQIKSNTEKKVQPNSKLVNRIKMKAIRFLAFVFTSSGVNAGVSTSCACPSQRITPSVVMMDCSHSKNHYSTMSCV